MPMIQTLPVEILTEILIRLPVKPLLRFRCVCKSFCLLIDSQRFVKMHLKQSLTTNSNRCLVLGGLSVYSISLDSLDVANALKPPYRCSDISNSCNGLMLILGETPHLWNPFTRNCKELPRLGVDYPDGPRVGAAYEIYGFGYDSKKDDYKVLRVVEFRGLDFEWIYSMAHVYSLRSATWRKIPDFQYQILYKRIWRVYANGALHTIVLSDYLLRLNPKIMAFNISSEEHYEVPLPDIPLKELNLVGLDMLEGKLCVLNARRKHRIDVWVMKEYLEKESWTKLLSTAPPLIERYSSLSPLAFSKDGNEVLVNCDDKWLVWYDLRSKNVRNVPVEGLPFIFNAEVAVESLVPLDSGGGVERFRNQCQQERTRDRKYRKKRDDFLSEGFKLVL